MKDLFSRPITKALRPSDRGASPTTGATSHPAEEFSSTQLLANILALLSGTALSRVLSAIVLIVIARQIGPEAYGQYSATIAFVGLTTVAFSLGLESWLLYQGGRDRDRIDVWSTSALLLTALLGVAWLAGLWAITPYLNRSSFPWILIVLASLSLWLEGMATIVWSAFKACLRNELTLLLMILSQGGFLGITLILAVSHVQDAGGYMGAKLLAACLGMAVSAFLLVRKLGLRLQWKAVRAALHGTLPFAASIAFSVIYGRADLAIVGHELGKEAAGVYAPALTLTNALFLIPTAIYGVMVPMLSRGYAQDRAWVRRTSARLILVMILVGIGLGLGLAWISQPVIELLYGPAFKASGDVLALLSGVLVLRCPTIALATVLVAGGWQMPRVGVQAVAAVFNVVLNFLIVHHLGVTGVAQIYILTEAVLLLGHLGAFMLWLHRESGKAAL